MAAPTVAVPDFHAVQPWPTRHEPDSGARATGARVPDSRRTGADGLTAAEVADREQRGLVNRADERTSRSLRGDRPRQPPDPVQRDPRHDVRADPRVRPGARTRSSGSSWSSNALLGIVQEWRAKVTLDRLAVVSAPHARVVREGEVRDVDVSDVVLDDLLEVHAGDQLVADGIVSAADGLEVDESLLTGRVGAPAQGRRRRGAVGELRRGRLGPLPGDAGGRRRVRAPPGDRGPPLRADALRARRRHQPHPEARPVGTRPRDRVCSSSAS